jgi:GTP cyclohydrolase II
MRAQKRRTETAPAALRPALRPLKASHGASAELPSEFGDFRVHVFATPDGKEHVALVHGEVADLEEVPTRVHSECLTGDVLGSLRCDCRKQLELALRTIGKMPAGIVLYLRQEGRGIGLANKIKAYKLQEQGLDTVEANLALGFADDLRDYGIAADMLAALGVRSIRLMTNNPNKVAQLSRYGVKVAGRMPHSTPPGRHNRHYLETKARRSGHLLEWVDA